AVAGLAAAYMVAPSWGYSERNYMALATAAAEQAIAIDPTLAIAYSVLGYAAQESRDLEKALELYDTAIRSDTQNATSWLWRGILYNEIGYFDKAVADIEQCLQIDPLYTNCMRHRARTALFTGDDDLAMELSERAMLLGFGMEGIVLPAYAACGNDEFVLAVLSDYFSDRDMRPLIDYAYRGIVDPDFDFAAERDEIRTVYRATTGKELDWGPDSFLDPMWLGAFELATANHWNQNWWHPYPREFLDSPHRKRLIVEAGLPGYWREHGFPAHCRPLGDDGFECDKPRRTSDKADRIRAGAPT
ncbi:MAG: tetratricopeptide repeat protein, partial [Woeseiaceae bacterium]